MRRRIFCLLFFGSFICQHVIGQQITVAVIESSDLVKYNDYPNDNYIEITLKENNNNHPIDLLTFLVNGQPPSGQANQTCTLPGSGDCKPANPQLTNGKLSINALDYEAYRTVTIKLFYGDGHYDIYVFFQNENDENPSLILENCRIMENYQEGECKLTVIDADGFLNQLKFTIKDSTNNSDNYSAEECFQINEISVIDTTYTTETTLSLKKTLDYETRTFYMFNVYVKDGDRPENFSFTFTVRVGDENDTPPEWITNKFNFEIEEENETGDIFNIQARDGDYGLNKDIEYMIENNNYATINSITGKIIIAKIDRDGPPTIDDIQLKVTAREKDDITSSITETLTILVLDIDDNSAKFEQPSYELKFDEGTTTEIEQLNIIAKDIDSGNNAVYTIEITNSSPGVKEAFDISPKKGREETSIGLIVKDVKLLDFEKYQSFSFTLQSKGENDNTKTATADINIFLLDVNDEIPKFDKETYSCSISEIASIGFELISIQATDADANDENLKHKLNGLLKNALKIEEYGGKITITKEKPFDYERQQEEYIQIQAIDEAGHTASVQLTINVLDVNDEPPKFVTATPLLIPENSKAGTVVGFVQATDVDTTADLEIKINWDSTKATKNGNNVDFSNYIGFLNVVVISNDPKNFSVNLEINEVIEGNTPDFELFDTVSLIVQVIDKETKEGDNMDKTTMIFNIENLNDNKPKFDSTQNEFQVVENSPADRLIGIIVATDADNLQKLSYTLTFESDADKILIEIDKDTGRLHTTGEPIDCDDPPRDNIIITVTANDGELESDPFEVTLNIIDQNDNAPTLDADMTTIEEDFYGKDSTNNGKLIFTLNVEDKDRDDQYNAKSATCNILNNNNYFAIKNDIEVYVDLKNGMTLDRELIEEHKITIQCYDSKDGGVQLTIANPPEFTITLSDVNDWTPTILTTETITTNENVKKDTEIKIIQAEDKDKGKNSEVDFSIIEARHCDDTGNECTALDETNNMFSLTDVNNNEKSVTLKVNRDLETLFGKYEVDIIVKDKGEPPLSSKSTIIVEIQKYNFKTPEITSPDESIYYLNTVQEKDSTLVQSLGSKFPELSATDGQGEKYTFKFQFNSLDLNQFIRVDPTNSKRLIWNGGDTPDENKEHTIDITAIIDNAANIAGEQPLEVTKSYTLVFFSVEDSDPSFSEPYTFTFELDENVNEFSQTIPQAKYPNIDLNLPIYYLLRDIDDYFNVDIRTGTVTLTKSIDYEVEPTHQFNIYASNKETIKQTPDDKSILSVTVKVNDINDNEPKFEFEQYYATVSVGNAVNTPIIKIIATDVDTVGSKLFYNIEEIKLPSNVPEKDYISIDKDNGQISLASTITQTMKGAFELKVCATDEAPQSHKTCTSLKIFIVTTENTVNFNFENSVNDVVLKIEEIQNILTEEFTYITHAETPTSSSTRAANDLKTVLPVYFIDNNSNEPKLSTDILKQITFGTTFSTLKQALLQESLILLSFDSMNDPSSSNLTEILKTSLIAVSVVLSALILILIIVFILKTRTLTNRINQLSKPKFGSQESGLNRIGLAIPTANRNAVEGANPVYNSKEDDDVISQDQHSIASGDSDLIGVEDNPEFDMGGNQDNISDEFPNNID